MSKPVIIDCDPGHDDAIALLLGAASPELDIRGITTVAGNQTVSKTTHNALRVLTVADQLETPVAAGAGEPLVRDFVGGGETHGESGLGGPDLPKPGKGPVDQHAVDFIASAIDESEDAVTLVPTGPLTNIALLLKRYPDRIDSIEEIILMGGSISLGNFTPAAEFNIFSDPEAASIVFNSTVSVTMIGLDVTRSVLFTRDDFERVREFGSEVATMVADLLEFYQTAYRNRYGWEGVNIHDACAVAEAIEPGVVTKRPMHVEIETAGEYTTGRTVCDKWGVMGKEPNAQVGVGIDEDRFRQQLFTALETY